MDRIGFFKEAFRRTAKAGLDLLEETPVGRALEGLADEAERKEKRRQRPPGAIHDETLFLAACTGCDLCMSACPHNVIMVDHLERRDPVIFPDSSPCVLCAGLPCIAACPTSALDTDNGETLRLL